MDARAIQQQAANRHHSFMEELGASMPTFDIPVGDSDYTAPGWLFVDTDIYMYPDVTYPWDPAVLQAIREFAPDVVPLTTRDTYRWSGYNERGHLGEPVSVIRHAVARADRNLHVAPHEFAWGMPVHDDLIYRTSSDAYASPRPNYMETIWHDRSVKLMGQDLPGAYLPHDWELYYSLRESFNDSLTPVELSERFIRSAKERDERRRLRNSRHSPGCTCDSCYSHSQIEAAREEAFSRASDQEITHALIGDYETPTPAPSTTVS